MNSEIKHLAQETKVSKGTTRTTTKLLEQMSTQCSYVIQYPDFIFATGTFKQQKYLRLKLTQPIHTHTEQLRETVYIKVSHMSTARPCVSHNKRCG